MSEDKLPVVAIVGRPNVGKSSFFNAVVGRRVSIVHEQSGVTRDRVAASASYNDRHFLLVDTGGLSGVNTSSKGEPTFDSLVLDQVKTVLDEAEHLFWVVDVKDGLTALDEEIAGLLRKTDVPVTIAVNKSDNETLAETAYAEFSKLGIGNIVPVSCVHNSGIKTCLDEALQNLPERSTERGLDPGFRLAIVGRPNVGKSAIINTLLGEDRVLESDVAGTTRDAVEIPIEIVGENESLPVTLVDTAGLRRRRQVDSVVEYFSVQRAESAIRHSDACLLCLDATQPATSQDRRIARIIADHYKPCVIAANKWDLAGEHVDFQQLKKYIRRKMAFMRYAPVSCVCAISGYNFDEIIENLFVIKEQMQVDIPTNVLNRFLYDISRRTPAAAVSGRIFKVYYGTLTESSPPTFLLFCNDPGLCPDQYRKFLQNKLKEAFFPAEGMPVRVILRPRREASASGKRQQKPGKKRKQTPQHKSKGRRKKSK